MGSITKFAALNTKIRALERHLLNDEDYQQLINANDLNAFIDYLKNNTAYQRVLEANEQLSIDQVEAAFKKDLFKKYENIVNFLHFEYRKLFKTLFMRYEVEDLKLFIRALNRNESIQSIASRLVVSEKYSTINREELIQSNTLDEFIDHLKGTDYYDVLKYSTDEDPKLRVFYMEMNLDILYFKKLGKEIKKITRKRNNSLLEVFGKNCDLLNLQWIYRGLKFYKLSPEELLNYVLLTGHFFNYNKLKEFCYASSIDELTTMIKQSKYSFLFEESGDFEYLMERNVERYIYQLFRNLNKQSQMNINKSVGYMHELEYEMRDLFTMMEATRYNLSAEEMKEFLVRKI